MPTKKPRDPSPEMISAEADLWIRHFVSLLEEQFAIASQSLTPDSSHFEYVVATIQAIMRTLHDSGSTTESVVKALGQVLGEPQSLPAEWTEELNQRRFALIDKQIQGTLTFEEKLDLARLTKIMRDNLDVELKLPTEALLRHGQMTDQQARDKPR